MESIGEKLRATREARKLSLRDVVKQTNITPMYIEALEDEDFEKFPSETYLIGFLRSYSDFLKLDPEEMITAYRGYRIGESVTPLEELTKPTSPAPGMYIRNFLMNYRIQVFAGAGILLLAILVGIVISMSSSDIEIEKTDSITNLKEEYSDRDKPEYGSISQLQLVNNRGFVLVSRNEAVQFMVSGKEVVFILEDIQSSGEEKARISLLPEKKKIDLPLNKQVAVTIPKVERQVVFTLKGSTDNRAKLMVTVGKQVEGTSASESIDDTQPVQDTTTVTAMTGKTLKIVFQARFIQKSFVEIYLDGAMRSRGFIPAGTVERWEAMETVQVKLGNAGGIDITINGKPYNFGGPGQVANKVIRWKRDPGNPNVYSIEVSDW